MQKEINILAIDQASTSGWCTKNNSGTWDLKTRKDESIGFKLLKFRSILNEICQKESIELIVYERIAGLHKLSLIHSAKMVAIIETFCEEKQIQFKAYSASEIKKFATGKGNAKKEQMIQACITKWKKIPKDDNEADAVALYHLADSEIN